MPALRVAVAQLPNRVGDLRGNVERIAGAMDWAEHEAGADVLVLPELCLTGYGLGDLVLHEEFLDDAAAALEQLVRRSGRTATVVGTVTRVPPQRSWDTRARTVAISTAILGDGQLRGRYHKVLLPSYDLFDEARHFAQGTTPDQLWRIGDVVAGVCICEDLWSPDGPPEAQSAAGAQILLVPNASPFHRGKAAGRLANTTAVAVRNGVPVVYVNCVGGQDDLCFDGGSLVIDAAGTLLHRGEEFAEDRFVLDVEVARPKPLRGPISNVHTRPVLRDHLSPPVPPTPPLSDVAAVWQAIVTTLRDYVDRNGFEGVALGLSGGIDSAVTAALAVDAVGADRVLAVAMPAPETAAEETVGGKQLAENLGLTLRILHVDTVSSAVDLPAELQVPETRHDRERRYARARAAVLADIIEESRQLVLATGNKSEISIGEASLHGDLAGGFAPLKDCPKTLVFQLARFRNERDPIFPEQVFTGPTTAQRLSRAWLPPYEVLDDIVQRYVELGQGLSHIVAAGHDVDLVEALLRRIDDAELIRRNAPPGVKVTSRAFTQDRRMPISNAWRAHRRPPHHDPAPLRPSRR